MKDKILDSTCFVYTIGNEMLTFRTPRMFVLKGAARRNAELLCLSIDIIAGKLLAGTTATDEAVIVTAVEFMRDCGFGEELLRDSLRGAEVPELSDQARTDIFANLVTLTWQMYGTLTLKGEIANIYHEHRAKVGRAPVRVPAAVASGARH